VPVTSEGQPQRKELILRVMEAKQKDVGRGKVRIDVELLASIGISPGDVVEIEGTRKTAAVAWANAAEDANLDSNKDGRHNKEERWGQYRG